MKCTCQECSGRGRINCPECEGSGQGIYAIDRICLDKSMPGYTQLVELQRDALRCIKQAEQLTRLNPFREASYHEQLSGCLAVINKQAEDVLKKKVKA